MPRLVAALALVVGCAPIEGEMYVACADFYEAAAECANCPEVIAEPECGADQHEASMTFCASLDLTPCDKRHFDADACAAAQDQVDRFRGLEDELAEAIESCEE